MEYDFAIVGAGLAGATTAYHLRAKAGDRSHPPPRVVIIEKEPTAGVHSSGRNAALVRRHVQDPVLGDLAARGADVLIKSELAGFQRIGSVLVGLGDESASDHFPLAAGKGLWCPSDGVIDVAGLLNSYLADQQVRCATEVLGWQDDPGRRTADGRPMLRVRTTAGELTARILINAAGPWAGTLGRLPLTPTNRHLFQSPPMASIDPDWPFVWDVRNGLYFRPESGGLLLCACDETPADPGVYQEDPRVAERLAELIETHQPGLGTVHIMRSWVGQRTFAPDHRFVIGFDPRDPRIFHVAALGGHGVTTSPAAGARAAEMLLAPPTASDDTGPFDPGRLL